ncbi:MAG: aspartate/glutamate racemase family protein, partial [Candidatus Aenigmarchaeota archaeon]|nr:aspartate/glutamate racemase family protein [Candidatus Aenigmarchaeota archaeon]
MDVFGNVKVGVLGGIGPEATGEFYSKLIMRLQETGYIKNNKDFPQLLVNSIPAPELIHETVSDSDLAPYVSGLRELDRFGVDFIIMVCNTIHLFYGLLQKEVNASIIDLRDEVRKAVCDAKIKSVFVLGTPYTVHGGLYRFDGIKSFEPSEDELQQLARAVFNFNRGVDKKGCIGRVREICQKYMMLGAETVIMGCTEFAVMLGKENISKINSIDVLVSATINRITGKTSEQKILLKNQT